MKLEIYRRADGKWAWRVRAANNQIVATDGGQGYENETDAMTMAGRLLDAETVPSVEVFGA